MSEVGYYVWKQHRSRNDCVSGFENPGKGSKKLLKHGTTASIVQDTDEAIAGDSFRNISESAITNRSVIASAEIPPDTVKEKMLVEAFDKLITIVQSAHSSDLTDGHKKEFLEILYELKETIISHTAIGIKLKLLFRGLVETISGIERIKPTAAEVIPLIEELWK
jgi:hypothetical protein